MTKSTVLVTGGTGYLASWIVHYLLKEGHDVRITVRDLNKTSKYDYLLQMEKETSGTLTVYEADLLKERSFDKAVDGCDIVFHTASPFLISGIKDAENELVKPAKDGTRHVLSAVNRSQSVKRVVQTSSVVAIYGDNIDMKGKSAFTEEDWNRTSSAIHQPYNYSKTLAEQQAWDMVKGQSRWDLVTINPSLLLGPSLTKRTDSTSISMMLDFLKGQYKTGVPHLVSGIVDVRDVAKAHLLAAFTRSASGRYIISNEMASFLDIAKLIEKNFPGIYPLPKREVPKFLIWLIAPTVGLTRKYISKNVGYPLVFDNSKSIQDLAMTYNSLEKTLVDQTNQLEKDGLV